MCRVRESPAKKAALRERAGDMGGKSISRGGLRFLSGGQKKGEKGGDGFWASDNHSKGITYDFSMMDYQEHSRQAERKYSR